MRSEHISLSLLHTPYHQVLFEEFGFASALCRPAPWFSAYEYSSTSSSPSQSTDQANFSNNSIVIDSGFSFTHILPFIDGSLAKHAVPVLFVCIPLQSSHSIPPPSLSVQEDKYWRKIAYQLSQGDNKLSSMECYGRVPLDQPGPLFFLCLPFDLIA
jgi:hypothetical protein